jgi:phospholipase C
MSVQHIFVLMLENRAFDHMLGFSMILRVGFTPDQEVAGRPLSRG